MADDDLGDFGDLGSLEGFDELEDLGDLEMSPDATPAAPAPAAPLSGLGMMIQDLLAKQNYQQIVQIAETQKEALQQDPQARAMVETARTQLAQAPPAPAAPAAPVGDGMLTFATEDTPLAPPPPAAAPAAPAPAAPAPPAPDPLGGDDLAALDLSDTDDLAGLDLGAPPAAVPQAPVAAPPPMAAPPPAAAPMAPPAMGGESLEMAPPAAAPPPASAPPDLAPPPAAPPAGGGGDDSQGRINELLQEGQQLFDQGDYQSAIDVWSRIFLIDIDNAEASRWIEEARGKKAELERQVEEIFHAGAAQVEQSQLEEAKASFRQVLELNPSHSLAREYLEQLEAGQVPNVAAASATATDDIGLVSDSLGDGDDMDPVPMADMDDGPSLEAAVQRDRVVVVKKTDRRLIALGALVAILVIGGGGFLATKWNDLFPNQPAEQPQAAPQVDHIQRATEMYEAGSTENAIAQLEKISTESPSYDKAQALITQWKAALEEANKAAVPEGPSQEEIARFNLLNQAARDAYNERLFIRARRYFARAADIMPLSAESITLKTQCDRELSGLEEAITSFGKGDYAKIIPVLWRKLDEEPDNRDARMLIIDSYYNLALTDLQRGEVTGAADKLREVLEIDPDSAELQRLKLFADTYVDRQPDLIYRIFVKYMPSRT